ncbi:MAG TPA: undecaprenyl-diphosphate phosphatase [Gammaproteobacteria bacterium]|nr:undecaprenyl-diphosphate phosphatase [Gammaproteobacteria bacterium]
MLALHLLILAIIQGVTELFPISSLGHSVLVPAVLHWPIDRQAPWFLPYIVVLHLGTAAALFIYFWRDWFALLGGAWKARGRPSDPNARLFWLLVAGTIPAGLIGLALEHKIRLLFGGFTVAAVFLMINGVILFVGDALKKRAARHELTTMGWARAFGIGIAQALALIPGISRSGVTLVAGVWSGLDYASSARFSFLLATPIIGAAGLLEVPRLVMHRARLPEGLMLTIVGGGILAGVFAWLSTWVLMKYLGKTEVTALRPFGIYCLAAGAAALLLRLA